MNCKGKEEAVISNSHDKQEYGDRANPSASCFLNMWIPVKCTCPSCLRCLQCITASQWRSSTCCQRPGSRGQHRKMDPILKLLGSCQPLSGGFVDSEQLCFTGSSGRLPEESPQASKLPYTLLSKPADWRHVCVVWESMHTHAHAPDCHREFQD